MKIFFATDLHGSELCWRKFLNAAKFYDAEVLICGGDMTGKAIVPIVQENGGFTVTLGAENQAVEAGQVAEVEAQVRRKDLYDASPIANYKIAGVPAISVVGVISALFLLFMLWEWSFNSANLYGTSFQATANGTGPAGYSVYYFVATYVVAIVIYVVARVVRKRQGIDLARIHHEIPVE
ncbi:MAG: hypothetical protein ABI334_10000 [Candidatus Dormiibacterota bacterium]